MDSKKKKIVLAVSIAAVLGMGICVMPLFGDNFAASRLRATVPNYGVVFNGTNGAASVASLKTNSANAKTGLDNNVKVDYKNVTPVSGKVGRILAKGSYGNSEPINDMTRIQVTSNAAADDAVLMWGATSGYLDHSIDLASAGDGVEVQGANFFKIVATNPVEVVSISVEFGCSEKNYGPYALNSSGNPLPSGVKFSSIEGGYSVTKGAAGSSVVKSIIPDYYDDGVHGLGPVIEIVDDGSYGIFEGNTGIEEIHYPNTIKRASGQWYFGGSTKSKVKEYTLPLNLEFVNNRYLPMGDLEVLNINSRNLDTNGNSCLTESNHPKLKTINVSYDVETLPSIIDSLPDGVTINYEGTEEEWETLAGNAEDYNWLTFDGDVVCSDTTVFTVTFDYQGGTLNGVQNSTTVTKKSGSSVANPGTPIHDSGEKQFVGWYDASEGGNKVVFPFVASENRTIYAHFEDYGPGSTFDNPINVTLGNSYTFTTDAKANTGYFAYTATADTIVEMKLTAADPSFSTINLRNFDSDGNQLSFSTGLSASAPLAKRFSPDPDDGVGSYARVRVANGEVVYFGVDGKTNSSTYYGSFTVEFNAVTAAGSDYTNAIALTSDSVTFTPADDEFVWYSFTPEVSGNYMLTNTPSAAAISSSDGAGATVAAISINDGVASFVGAADFNAYASAKSVIKAMEAGTTYYICVVGRGKEITLSISDEVPESLSKDVAKTLVVDGEAATVAYNAGFPTKWFKFTAESAGKYVITGSKTLSAANSWTSWTSDNSTPYIGASRFGNDDTETKLTVSRNSANNKQIYFTVSEAGTYYVKALTSSTNCDYTIALSKTKQVTLSFDTQGGSTVEPISVENMFAINANDMPDNPTKANYKFDGWYMEPECQTPFSRTNGIQEDTTIYAKWIRVYTVTLHWNDGETNTVTYGSVDENTPFAPTNPTYVGHGFLGWFYDADFNQPFDVTALVTGDFELFAKWEVRHYNSTAGAYIEQEVTGSGEYLYSYDSNPKGIVDPTDSNPSGYDFVVYSGGDYVGEDGKGIKSSNKGKGSTASEITLNFKKACRFTFTYTVQSESNTQYDYFSFFIGGTVKFTNGGSTIKTATVTYDIDAGQSVKFRYEKDGGVDSGLDQVFIYDMKFESVPLALSSISVDASAAKRVYELNEEFSASGIVVTAHYNDDSSAVVTPTSVSTPNMTADSIQEVTVSYTEGNVTKTAAYKIRVGNPSANNSAASFISGLDNASTYLDDVVGIEWDSTYGFESFSNDDGNGIKSKCKTNSSSSFFKISFKSACTFTFTFKASSEAKFDGCYIIKNEGKNTQSYVVRDEDNNKDFVSGTMTNTVVVTVEAGDSITFKYFKDSSSSSGDDCIYIYNISFAAIA